MKVFQQCFIVSPEDCQRGGGTAAEFPFLWLCGLKDEKQDGALGVSLPSATTLCVNKEQTSPMYLDFLSSSALSTSLGILRKLVLENPLFNCLDLK
jgi:hypothetical protein